MGMLVEDSPNFKIMDGDPKVYGEVSLFAMMNEDLYQGVPNCEVLPGGLFRALKDLGQGTELCIRYAKDYNWNELKEATFADMTREIAGLCPRTWKYVPKTWEQAKRNHDCVSRWLVKLVEGKLGADSMHLTCGGESLEPHVDLARLITFGPFCRKFCFRI
jgi:hypothetical protein